MARTALNSDDVKIEQTKPVVDPEDRKTIVRGDETILKDKDYADRLAMGEDPVTIVINPSGQENAPTSYPAWVNGKGAEALVNGQWMPIIYVPVGVEVTLKRKYVEVLGRAKETKIKTVYGSASEAQPRNEAVRTTTAVCNFSVLKDDNPRGVAWLSELLRRQA